MENTYKKRWDERYRNEGYAYGTAPNLFFREQLEKLPPGSLLLPADGEGRNGVFAAEKGWRVTSFDLSAAGKEKALKLAGERGVSLEYLVGDLPELSLQPASFDAIGLIYAHFTAEKKSAYHRQLARYLKPGGTVILEGFSKNHLALRQANPGVGGPDNLPMLFSTEEILSDFEGFTVKVAEEVSAFLEEGKYHNGNSSVVRFVGTKTGV